MANHFAALAERYRALSDEAERLRSQDHTKPADMIHLAKILSRKAQLETQLAAMGVTVLPKKTKQITTDELCPF